MAVIRDAREAMPHYLTLREMEECTGISRSRVSDLFLEKSGSPSLQEFITLCLAFNLEPSDVLEKANESILEKNKPKTDTKTAQREQIAAERAKHAAEYGLAAMEGTKRDEDGWDS